MSRFANIFIKYLGIGLLLMFVAISLKHHFDWTPYENFLKESDNKGTWIPLERGMGFYPPGLDKIWAYSIFSSLNVKVALRESIQENENNLGFAYEAKAMLNRPNLSEEYRDCEVDYRIDFLFKFIDEDGFVIWSINSSWFNPSLSHEKYEKTYLIYTWGDQEKNNEIIKVLFDGKISRNVAKKVKKIIYEPSIIVTGHRKKQGGP